jgi:hypothetical protein
MPPQKTAKKIIVPAPSVRIARAQPKPKKIALPLRADPVVPQMKKTISGDVIIDGRNARNLGLKSMGVINGNLYLQNMRGYILPCGIRINGDLLLRDVGQLKFCGCFEIAGNIYVSRNSSFGPIPKDAHLGGQVIF